MIIPEADETEIRSRLDLSVMRAYGQAENIRSVRNHIIKEWRTDDTLSPLALSRQEGLSDLTEADEQRAIATIADYWFEPYVVSSMNIGQARDYYLAAQNSLRLETQATDLQSDRPLVLETLHHSCIFSVLYLIVQHLVRDFGFKKVVLLHLREPLDPRLEVCRALVERILQAEAVSVLLNEKWMETLSHAVTDSTVVLYMGDMPPSIFPKLRRPEKASSRVRLYAEPDIELIASGISMASLLARRFKASHYTLDFPARDVARLQPRNEDATLSCPLPDWVFWPALPRWYQNGKPESRSASAA